MRPFWISLGIFGLLFSILFSIRSDVFNKFLLKPEKLSLSSIDASPERDVWMTVLQNDRKIGSSHTRFTKIKTGYLLKETLYMRLNTMGLVQDLILKTTGELNADFTLSSFHFGISSGRFHFSAQGRVSGKNLSVKTNNFGTSKTIKIPVEHELYAASTIVNAARNLKMTPGDVVIFQVFDPLSMVSEPVRIEVVGEEDIFNMGVKKSTIKLAMIYKGSTQFAWIGKNGEVIREEGLLGFRLEKSTRNDALFGLPFDSSQDLTTVASVRSNVIIDDPLHLERLEVEISGIQDNDLQLQGGRQVLKDQILSVTKENISDLHDNFPLNEIGETEKGFLRPEPFIESDHPKIRNLVDKIISVDDTPFQKINKLLSWIQKNIKKQPVLSLPDALATFENKVGDCNEHAVLLAALAKAAGIPARIETGLVYLNGRFYYHAWNLLFIGKWVTVDSLFNQVPADVTHIRFSGGAMQKQFDLMNIIGKVKLKIIAVQ